MPRHTPRTHRPGPAATIAGTLACLAIAATTPSALAGGGDSFPGINADLQAFAFSPGPKPSAAYGAASGQAGFWNIVPNIQNASFTLNDLDGVPSGVTVTIITPNTSGSQCVSGIVSQNWSALMCDYVWDTTGVVNPVTIEVDNLPPGAYTVFVYGCFPGQSFSPGRTISVQAGNDPPVNKQISGAVLFEQFGEGVTHTTHAVNIGPGEVLTIESFDTSGEFGDSVVINGFQIVPVPDPIAQIALPFNFQCACNPTLITGIATASGGQFSFYTLEWSTNGADPWQTILTSTTPVNFPGGTLGSWNTSALAEGFYFIRLTVQAVGKAPQTAVTVVYLDKNFSGLAETSLAGTPIAGGTICIGGTVAEQCFDSYTVDYRPLGTATFFPVNPAQLVYTTPAVNQTFATWDTLALGIPDGDYQIRIVATTVCGNEATLFRQVRVDNTLPVVKILSPSPCSAIGCEPIEIIGTVNDAALNGWTLQYANPSGTWTTLATGNTEQSGDVLAVFDPAVAGGCPTTFRLVATDSSIINCNGAFANSDETLVSVSTGPAGDIDGDGDVDSDDLGLLLGSFGTVCP